MILQFVLIATAILVTLAALLVTIRFLVCLVKALKSRSYGYAAASLFGIFGMLCTLGIVTAVWFIYAVSHTGKDVTTDLHVFLVTVPPCFVIALVLWFLAGRLRMHQR